MRTFAMLLILVAIAASRRSRSVFLRGQPHHWLTVLMAAIAHCIGR
ncbi:MAG: hypothetical protein HND47_00150 [Chloroflexi bacterium]|nr:hypothetical protein [Chloroflexota bacterium]